MQSYLNVNGKALYRKPVSRPIRPLFEDEKDAVKLPIIRKVNAGWHFKKGLFSALFNFNFGSFFRGR